MNWMNEAFYLMLLTSITGSIAYLVWLLLKTWMERKKKLWYVLPMLTVVLPFFAVPVVYLQLKISSWMGASEGASHGILFVRTPLIYNIQCVAGAIWVIGIIVNAGIYLYRAWKLNRVVKKFNYPADDGIWDLEKKIVKELKIKDNIIVCQNITVPSPLVLGIFTKRIILPMQKYDDEERKVILYHEMVHIKQKVLLIKHIAMVVRLIHWVNPCVYAMVRSFNEWGETACDLSVRYQTKCGLTFREYFEIVLRELEKKEICFPETVAEFRRTKGLRERIMKINGYKKEKDLKIAGGVLAICLFCAACTTTAFAAGGGFREGYNKIYDKTVVAVDESGIIQENTLVECEEVFDESAENVIEMELGGLTRGVYNLNWSVPKNSTTKTSSTYYVKKGGTISILFGVDPSDKQVRAGIITPNGTKRYVTGSSITHTFDVTSSGDYYIFIENTNGSSVTVSGSFSF